MDSHVNAIEVRFKYFCSMIFFISYSEYALATGDIDAIYNAIFMYTAFLMGLIIILRMKSKAKKIKSLALLVVLFLVDYFLSLFVPFVEYKSIILTFSFFNIIFLYGYIFYQNKKG